uniref:Uncharacterized protein n=1 Tax=Trypanosoma vivax (strain Y486) TaxID=1055687 RepID=G0U2G3_TRYVY|nr:hypothetical protein TVY486_0902880 [Trypanosoma vivax Y486]
MPPPPLPPPIPPSTPGPAHGSAALVVRPTAPSSHPTSRCGGAPLTSAPSFIYSFSFTNTRPRYIVCSLHYIFPSPLATKFYQGSHCSFAGPFNVPSFTPPIQSHCRPDTLDAGHSSTPFSGRTPTRKKYSPASRWGLI